jgi:FAD/FMN-containing dehydrogenase
MQTKQFSISELRDAIKGRVIGPADSGYDDARTVFVGGIDRRPAAIVRVAGSDDVAQAVLLARDTGVELAVRSGGHSAVGHSTTDGGIVVDVSEMKAFDIDVASRTVWADAGLTAGEYSAAAAAHGLATGFGDTASVGIGGITLGGGIGYLVRKHGLTIDDLVAAEVVTAEGEILTADTESHPDLFWALRGGGGNFGVVTRFRFRLHDVSNFVGGMLLLPATPSLITDFIAAADAAPGELSTIANVMVAPPMPFVPEEAHGRLVIMALVAYAGNVEESERAIAPLRALAPPLADFVRPISYPEIYPPDEQGYHPMAAGRNLFVDALDHSVAETIVAHLEDSTAPMRVAQLRVLGGAAARVPATATAFVHRTRPIMVNVAAVYQDPSERPAHEEWTERFATVLRKGDPSAYIGFVGDEGPEKIRAAYPGPTWERLQAVKARYDPANLFRLNQNIPPLAKDPGS